MSVLLLFQSAASTMSAPISLENLFLGLNTLTCLAIVWGGGRLLGKLETNLDRQGKLLDDIEKRVGYLEGRRG